MSIRVFIVVGVLLALAVLGHVARTSFEQLADLKVSALPEGEWPLATFLLLLPVAALICSIVRNVVGLRTFGTFAPALLGLAFRDASSPLGFFLLLVILSIGWVLRRGVAMLNLLQVSRSAVLLSLVVVMLIGYIFWSNSRGQPVATLIPFLPLVIVTGLIERFWQMEEEEGFSPAAWTMSSTWATAMLIYGLTCWQGLVRQFTEFPENTAIVIALQILVGRYMGYRLSELRRFQED